MAKKNFEQVKGADNFPLKGTFVYPKVNKPDTKFKNEGQYQVRLRVPAEQAQPVMDRIDALAQEALAETKATLIEQGKKVQAAKLSLAKDKPYRPALDDDGNETGEIEFNFKMTASGVDKDGRSWTRAPKFFSASGKELKGEDIPQVWGGTVGRVSGTFNPFCTAIGAGVSLRLGAIQIIELVTGGGGGDAASMGFGAEDGYEPPPSEGAAEGFAPEDTGADAPRPQF